MCKFWRSMCKFWRSCVKIEEIVEFLWDSWRSRRSTSLYSIYKIPQNFCEKLFWRSRRSQKWCREIGSLIVPLSIMDTAISPWLLWIKFAFVYLDFVDQAAIMEQRGRFGSIRMVWTWNTGVSPGKSGSMMSLTSYWRNGAPVLVVMTSRASSPYLNCVGW